MLLLKQKLPFGSKGLKRSGSFNQGFVRKNVSLVGVGHRQVKDCLMTGVCFTDDGHRVSCVAYDTEKF